VALHQAQQPAFKDYQQTVLENAKALASRLGGDKESGGLGYNIVSGGTDNHLVLIDLKDKDIDGARVERILELVGVAANKNTVPGDKSAMKPGGLRMGTPAMTTRGFQPADFKRVADVVHRAVNITKMLDGKAVEDAEKRGRKNPKSVNAFREYVKEGEECVEILELRREVEDWVGTFNMGKSIFTQNGNGSVASSARLLLPPSVAFATDGTSRASCTSQDLPEHSRARPPVMAAPEYFSYSVTTYTVYAGNPASAIAVTSTATNVIGTTDTTSAANCEYCEANGIFPAAHPTLSASWPPASATSAQASSDIMLDRKLNWIPSDDPRRDRLHLYDLWRISTSEPDEDLTPTSAQHQMARERAQQRQSIVSIVETEINYDDEIDDQPRDRRSQQWTITAEGDIEMRTMQRQGYAFLNSPDYQQARMMQIMIEHEIYDEAQFNAEMRNRQMRGERWSQDFY
ncbi:putative serine hydroxymethyltransferase, partial [Hortaea werneckii]